MSDGAQMTFEAALERLEEIVSKLERGDCTLDESLTLFEEGSRLRTLCAERLQTAADKVADLSRQSATTDAMAEDE